MQYSALTGRILSSLFVFTMFLAALLSSPAHSAPLFTDSGVVLTGLSTCSVAWGDYDKDGHMDLAACGNTGSGRITRIYHNDGGGVFTAVADLLGVSDGALAWGDYDNDGDLDLAVAGYTGSVSSSKIYANMGSNEFRDIEAGLRGARFCSLAWGDYDNDGRLDLAIAGSEGKIPFTQIYHNNGNGEFEDIRAEIVGVSRCSVAWGDYDNDGFLDLAVSGNSTSGEFCGIYHNNGEAFDRIEARLPPLTQSSLAWGDYDNDGNLDLAVAGLYGEDWITKVFRNNGSGSFRDIEATFTGVCRGSVGWGDFDNDGDLDLLVSGYTGTAASTVLYRNTGGVFSALSSGLPSVYDSSVSWGDYDNDNRLDVAIAGYTGSENISRIYHSNTLAANTPPTAPTGLSITTPGTSITFSWAASTDTNTPTAGLTYNLRVGTAPGKDDIFCSMANPSTGKRFVPAPGNAQKRLSWTLRSLPVKNYYWSVQAIDTAYAGSAWAAEKSITAVKISGQVLRASGNPVQGVTITASGASSTVTNSTGYYELNVYTGWSGTLTASKPYFSFTPPNRSYSNLTAAQNNQNFTVAESFTEVSAGLTDMYVSHVAWGDYNNDGYLDLAAVGATSATSNGHNARSFIYRNNGNGTFSDIGANLISSDSSMDYNPWESLCWTDFNNDGCLDLSMSGYVTQINNGPGVTLFANTASGFIKTPGPGMSGASGHAWGDSNNDGRIDIAAGGLVWNGNRYIQTGGIFPNLGSSFGSANPNLGSYAECTFAWADIDNDGDLDLAAANKWESLVIYRNDGNNVFTSIATLPINADALAWGDYDNDGDFDLVASGVGTTGFATLLFRNDNATFTQTTTNLPPVYSGSLAWGDYDNDGDPDLLIAGGLNGSTGITRIYRNNGGGEFADTGLTFPGTRNGSVAWGDYDNDNDLDIAISGTSEGNRFTRIYKNNGGAFNSRPTAPTNLTITRSGTDLLLSWNASTDAQTPAAGLSYNLRIGTEPGKDDIFSGMANPTTGLRRIPAPGNAQKRLSWTIKNAGLSSYYCAVQAIDTALAGSAWSTEKSIVVPKISGIVKNGDGTPVSGVTISADDGGTSTTTDANGYYRIWVPVGWSGTVTLAKDSMWFSPINRIYSNLTVDQANQDYFAGALVATQSTSPVTPYTAEWGDFDNDGDLDLVASDLKVTPALIRIFRNDGTGAFSDNFALPDSIAAYSFAWGDYDNDGDIDLLAGGQDGIAGSRIYRNDGGGVFTSITGPFSALRGEDVEWLDYDGDGKLDLLINGVNITTYTQDFRLYHNDGGGRFTDSGITLPRLIGGVAVGDFNNDSLPDLAAANIVGTGCGLLHNNGDSTFSVISLPSVVGNRSVVSVGDYDNDGYQDILFGDNDLFITVLHNDGSAGFSSTQSIIADDASDIKWGDMDNDGDSDLMVLCRNSMYSREVRIFRNDAGTFNDTGCWLSTDYSYNALAWGDCDRDGDLDFFTGTAVFKNAGQFTNTAPAAPAELMSTTNGIRATLTWAAPADDHTPGTGLTYNVKVGTTPGGNDILSGASDASGLRRIPGIGNAGGQTSFTLSNLSAGTYYWNVQAVDSAYVGSPWSAGGTFTISAVRISGRITTTGGAGVDGVKITASNGGGTAVSDSLGNYSVCVPIGWQGAVSFSSGLYTFDPPAKSYTSVTADITGQDTTAVPYLKISGRLKTKSGEGMPDFAVSSNDDRTSTTDYLGYYEIMVPSGWSGVITPTNTNFSFIPASISYTDVTEDQPNRDYTLGVFVDINAGLPGICNGSVAWGDYDNDGDLDIALAGLSGATPITRIYQNNGGSFTDINAGLPGIAYCSIAWGDYDNDGDLDLALAGSTTDDFISRIYRNDGSSIFTNINAGLTGMAYSCLAWGDYDNDGDLDLVIAGADTTGNPLAKIYRNNSGSFTSINAGLVGLYNCSLAWGDYDRDGDLDLVISGSIAGASETPACTRLYRNDNGTFTDTYANLPNVMYSSVAWADVNNDGFLDLAIAGSNEQGYVMHKLLTNNHNGTFTAANSPYPFSNGSLAWGDCDNDGDLDLAAYGAVSYSQSIVGAIERSSSGTLSILYSGITPVKDSSLAWGDYDNDGDLDLLVAGDTNPYSGYGTSSPSPICSVYRNDIAGVNTQPTAPTELGAVESGVDLILSWSAAADSATTTAGLTYNLRVGTTPGGSDILSAMSAPSGTRLVPSMGNAGHRLSYTLRNLPAGTYYWSVQSIDTAFAGSPWASSQMTIGDTEPPVIDSITVIPSLAAAGDPVSVTVNAADNIGVTNVTANGISLAHSTGNTWAGILTADPAKGLHPISVIARDAAGNSTTDTQASYKTAPVYGVSGRSIREIATSQASVNCLFRTWGKVTAESSELFNLDDGSGLTVRVICPGYAVETGDYASVRGVLDTTANPPTITTSAGLVRKLN